MWTIAAIVICFCFSSLKNFSSLFKILSLTFIFRSMTMICLGYVYVFVRACVCVCFPMSSLELLELLWFMVCFISQILQSSWPISISSNIPSLLYLFLGFRLHEFDKAPEILDALFLFLFFYLLCASFWIISSALFSSYLLPALYPAYW